MQENKSASPENENIEFQAEAEINNNSENLSENEDLQADLSDSTLNNESSNSLEVELAEWKDKYMRLFAEFDNYKKRSFKEKMEVIQTGGKDVMMPLLDVMDDMSRAEKQLETASDIEAVKEGMMLVFNKLKHALQSKGLKAFDSIGEVFDVEKHEAVTEIPASSPEMEGKVMDELQKGYTLNDKLIRHAKVVVGKMG
jgi:molecular chaperone GrpE